MVPPTALRQQSPTWEVHEITVPLYGPDDEDPLGLDGIARSEDGEWLATGVTNAFDEDGDGPEGKIFHVWRSSDGLEWRQGSAPVADTDGTFGTMNRPIWTRSGFLVSAATESDDPSGLFLSADDNEWELVAEIRCQTSQLWRPTVLRWSPSGYLSKPTRVRRCLANGSPVYISPDGRTWEHPSPFTLDKGHVNAATFTSDGRLLLAGSDITGCREFFCVFTPDNGTVPAVWIGTPN